MHTPAGRHKAAACIVCAPVRARVGLAVAALLLAFATPSARAQSVCTAPLSGAVISSAPSSCASGCTATGSGSMRAHDGSDATAFQSAAEVNPWLLLDLAAVREVVHVFLLGGTTLAHSQNLALKLSNSSTFDTAYSNIAYTLCASGVGQTAAKQFFTVTCAAGAVGRLLNISSSVSTSRTLALTEVTVFEKGGYWHV